MFHMPDIDQLLTRYDTRLDNLDQDMHQMVVLLQHIDKTLGQLLQIQEAQLAASVSFIAEKDVLL